MTKTALFSKEHDITAFASTDETRQVLQSVHYNAKGGFLEATNGRQLVRVPVEVSEDFPTVTGANGEMPPDCIIPLGPFKKALASIPKHSALPVISNAALTYCDEEKARLTTNDLDTENSQVFKIVEGNYPNTEQVVPHQKSTFEICFNPNELSKVVDYCKKHGNERENGNILFEFNSSTEPVRWRIFTQGKKWVTGVLMPCRK